MIPLYFPPINSLGNVAFRKVCLNAGANFVFTEMVKVEDLMKGVEYQFNKLSIPEDQRENTFCQIICEDIENIPKGVDIVMKVAPFLKEINYNMGCPQSSLCKSECGGGIISNPEKVKRAADLLKESCDKYKVRASIKIRLGLTRESINIKDNVRQIEKAGIEKIYIHGRCLKDSYSDPATYSEIGIVKKEFPEITIIANGDVTDSASLKKIIEKTKCDGVLIGRAAIKDPHIFKKLLRENYSEERSGVQFETRIKAIREVLEYTKEQNLPLDKVKSNLVNMTKEVIGASEFRRKLNDLKTVEEILKLLQNQRGPPN